MIGLLSPMVLRAIAVAAVLAALTMAYHWWAGQQRDIGRAEVRVEWQAHDLAVAEQNRLLLMANAKASDKLQAQADKERTALHAENRDIGLRLDESLKRLRNRPERPPAAVAGSVPADTVAAPTGPGDTGCTGTGLFLPDSEFLTRLASSADRLRAALRSCRAAYERAAQAVNGNSN